MGREICIESKEYRKSNKFNSVEDLKNVSGIGDSLYNKVKDNITV